MRFAFIAPHAVRWGVVRLCELLGASRSDFARRFSTRVWDVSGGTVVSYPGTLGDYLDQVAARQEELEATFALHGLEHARGPSAKPTRAAVPEPARAESKKARLAAREEKKRTDAERKKREKAVRAEVERTEALVARLEAEKAALELTLADPKTLERPDALAAASARLARVGTELEATLEAWTVAEAEREALAAALAESVDVVDPSEQLRPARPVRDRLRGEDLPIREPDPLNADPTRGDDERAQLRCRGEDASVPDLVAR